MPYFALRTLIRYLLDYIDKFEGKSTQEQFREYLARHGATISKNTMTKMAGRQEPDGEQDGIDEATVEILTRGLERRLRELKVRYPHSDLFNPLACPEIGWILDRLNNALDPLLNKEHLIMNHESRYLLDDYKIRLTVCPSRGQSIDIRHSGLDTEQFKYNNIALVKYRAKFAAINQKTHPGFTLGYTTLQGRLELLKPVVAKLTNPSAYRIQKMSAAYQPEPHEDKPHRLELLVYGGYNQGQEVAHFKMAQPAVYRNVTFSLDLTSYPADAFIQRPELVMVPVLTDREYDCCDIARTGQGLKILPNQQLGLSLTWRFRDLANVMICTRWQVDHDRIPPEYDISRETLLRTQTTR